MYNRLMQKSNIFYKVIVVIFLIFNSQTFAKTVVVDKDTKLLQLLPVSSVYIDQTKSVSIDDILQGKQKEFKENSAEILEFGYAPDLNIWIKVTLKNNSCKKIDKLIEYSKPLSANKIEFYDSDLNYKVQYGGVFYKESTHKTLHPVFHVSLKPKESKVLYIKTFSKLTPLVVELKLWDTEEFYNKEIRHQIILALFFVAMILLAVYNLTHYFLRKDRSYLFYVTYVIGLIFYHLIYVGFGNVYLFNDEEIEILIQSIALILLIPIYALAWFTKSFLETEQYTRHNQILNFFLILTPVSILFFLVTDYYDKFSNFITVVLVVYLFYLTIYTFIKKNKYVSFILLGWIVFILSGVLIFLSYAGVFSVYKYFPYFLEVVFLVQAMIFSIALTNKFKSLQKETNDANNKLILQKKQETTMLEKKVEEKTQNLTDALSEKDVLLKELNHRVKNNMQTIISLIRLQSYEVNDIKFQGYLQTIQNRIAAMSHLHELLYNQENVHHIQTAVYFQTIVDELKESYSKDIEIELNITNDLETDEAIYCGLIVNELVTNSIKYAFDKNCKDPKVSITLCRENYHNNLVISDNGRGYDENTNSNSLGLTLVETLAQQQLEGEYYIDTSNGTKTTIKWKSYGKN